MRKLLIVAILAALATAVVPARAEGEQPIQGSILLPTRYPNTDNGDAEGPFPGAGRRLYIAAMKDDAANGQIASIIKIDPSLIGGTFWVGAIEDMTGEADLDVYFYIDLGDDVYGETPPDAPDEPEYTFDTRAPGGEAGLIPEYATYAIVVTPNGIDTTFTWTAAPAA